MLSELLSIADRHNKVVGIRVRSTRNGYEVLIWLGPSVGERLEWHRLFATEVPRTKGLDEVAALVVAYCAEHGDCAGAHRSPGMPIAA